MSQQPKEANVAVSGAIGKHTVRRKVVIYGPSRVCNERLPYSYVQVMTTVPPPPRPIATAFISHVTRNPQVRKMMFGQKGRGTHTYTHCAPFKYNRAIYDLKFFSILKIQVFSQIDGRKATKNVWVIMQTSVLLMSHYVAFSQ